MTPAGVPLRRVRWYDVITPQAISLGVSVVAVIGAFLFWNWQSGAGAAIAQLRALSQEFLGLNLFLDFSNLLLLGACLWVLSRVTDPGLPARFGRPTRRVVLTGIAAGVAAVLLSLIFEYLCDTYLHTSLSQDSLSLPVIPRRESQFALGVFTAAILAPLAEEAYFRGVVMGWLARHVGNSWALLGSSLLFGTMHLKLFAPGGLTGILLTAELTGMGLLLGIAAARTGSLWASFIAHAINNFCAVLASIFLAP